MKQTYVCISQVSSISYLSSRILGGIEPVQAKISE